MELILLEKVKYLGNLGDKVTVKRGYGRNFLIPYGKAVPATASNIADFEHKRIEFEKKAKEQLAKAQKRADALDGISIEIKALTSAEGKLYGSIGQKEIAAVLNQHSNTEINKAEVYLAEGAIRYLGEYEVQLHLHSDVLAMIKVMVVAG